MVCDTEQQAQLRPAEDISSASSFCIATSAGFLIGDTMKKIKLTQGKFALVDDADYEWLVQFKWCIVKVRRIYYAIRAVQGKTVYMHRFMLEAPKDMDIDHINHNGLDNRRANLRICTHIQNLQNKRSSCNGTSKYKGVSWCKRDKKWTAQIEHGGQSAYLGRFANELEAANAYDKAAKELHGEFAYLNTKARE